jgi:hypothetical protein
MKDKKSDPAYDNELCLNTVRRWGTKLKSQNKLYEQCEMCYYYIPILGLIGEDYGVCTNEKSEFDSKIMFEHDGCEHHVDFTLEDE